jgi:hypothetical protein
VGSRTVAPAYCLGIEMLDKYLRFRAHLEGAPYELTPEFLQIPFNLECAAFSACA